MAASRPSTEEQLALLESSPDVQPEELIRARLDLAWDLNRSQPERSDMLCEEVRQQLESCPDEGLSLYRDRVLSELRFLQGRLPDALAAAESAQTHEDHPDWSLHRGIVLTNAGRSQFLMGRFSEALPIFRKLYDLAVESGKLPQEASSLSNLAIVCCSTGDLEAAKRFFQQSLDLYQQLEDLDGQATIYNNMAMHPALAECPERALEWARKALDLSARCPEPGHELVILDTYGRLLADAGELDDARSLFEDLIEKASAVGNHRVPLVAQINLARVLLQQNELEAAEATIESTLPLLEQHQILPEQVRCFGLLAELRERQGRVLDALQTLKRHQSLKEQVFGGEERQRVQNLQVVYETQASRKEVALQRRRADELETLAELGRSISSSLDPDIVLGGIAEAAIRLLNGCDAAILQLDATGEVLEVITAAGDHAAEITALRVPTKASLAGAVCLSGKAELINAPADDPRTFEFGRSRQPADHSSEAWDTEGAAILAAALHDGDATIGTILVWKHKASQGLFTEEHLSLLVAFAQQVSIALGNARLHSELVRAKLAAEDALLQVKTLKGLVPICSHCKNIRDDAGFWHNVADYMREHSEAEFSHGICPECVENLYPDLSQSAEQPEPGSATRES